MNNPPAAPDKQYLPGDFAIWIFIFAELLVFGIFFLSYAFARAHNVELFNEHQLLLDRESGAINTVILITSSFFVVCAVNAIRGNAATACARWMGLALLAGACFIGIKLQEFGARYDAGISLSTSTFFMFYLSLTFFHFMHVLSGYGDTGRGRRKGLARQLQCRKPYRCKNRRILLAHGGPGVDRPVPAGLPDEAGMTRANRNALLVWLVLVMLTGASYTLGRFGFGGTGIMLVLLLSVTLKGQLVADHFMGLRGVRSRWRRVVTGWLLVVVALIGLAYLPGEY